MVMIPTTKEVPLLGVPTKGQGMYDTMVAVHRRLKDAKTWVWRFDYDINSDPSTQFNARGIINESEYFRLLFEPELGSSLIIRNRLRLSQNSVHVNHPVLKFMDPKRVTKIIYDVGKSYCRYCKAPCRGKGYNCYSQRSVITVEFEIPVTTKEQTAVDNFIVAYKERTKAARLRGEAAAARRREKSIPLLEKKVQMKKDFMEKHEKELADLEKRLTTTKLQVQKDQLVQKSATT